MAWTIKTEERYTLLVLLWQSTMWKNKQTIVYCYKISCITTVLNIHIYIYIILGKIFNCLSNFQTCVNFLMNGLRGQNWSNLTKFKKNVFFLHKFIWNMSQTTCEELAVVRTRETPNLPLQREENHWLTAQLQEC